MKTVHIHRSGHLLIRTIVIFFMKSGKAVPMDVSEINGLQRNPLVLVKLGLWPCQVDGLQGNLQFWVKLPLWFVFK
jgi:hypothetical protein